MIALEVNILCKKLKDLLEKNIITNIYRIQVYNSIVCRYFSVGFIDFMLRRKSLVDYTNLFSPNYHEKNDKIVLKNFQLLKRWKNCIALFAVNIENLKNLKYHTS